MARVARRASGDRLSSAQFFITLEPQPALSGQFTVFGQVVDGMDVLRALTPRNPALAGQPTGDYILSIEIIEKDAGPVGALRIGQQVTVTDTGDCLRIRSAPSLTAQRIDCLTDGISGVIDDGPIDADGYRWWHLENHGWAVDEWLQ